VIHKKILHTAITAMLVTSLNANSTSSHLSGAYGNSLSHFNLFATDHNPAMGSLMLKEDEFWRHSLIGGAAVSAEVGDVNNFVDDIDELIDILDDPDSSDIPANEVLDRFNNVLEQAGEDGYILTGTEYSPPILPLFFRINRFDATVNIDLRFSTLINARILDAPLERVDETFTTASALYLKSGIERQISLNYAQKMWERNESTLFLGAKIKFISTKLSKQTVGLETLDGDNIEDVIEDQYDKNVETTNNISLDIGAVWEAPHYRLGLTLFDVNSPKFDYGDIGLNCDQIQAPSDERDACNIAAFFAIDRGEITTSETHTKHARLNTQATYKLRKNWLVNASYDLAEYDNLAGLTQQNIHLSTHYNPNRWLFNGMRLAYNANVSEQGTSQLVFGVSVLNGLNLDLFYGLESVKVDDSEAPRSVGLALSITEQF